MAVYINAAEAISPQNTFHQEDFLSEIIAPENNRFHCIQPVYKEYISAKLLRRMSKIIRMGVATAKQTLAAAGVENPDGILIGTGLGCVQDTVKFLEQLQENKEQLLNPTAFIQSVHNTVSGQIALLLGCQNYNLTFTQRTLSFENALMDAHLMLNETSEEKSVLLGGIDELTDQSYQLLEKAGCLKKDTEADLLESQTSGYYPGEGAGFFALTNQSSSKNLAEINHLAFHYGELDETGLGEFISAELNKKGLSTEDVDLVMTGSNGDFKGDAIYRILVEKWFPNATTAAYKHLSGEYDTATAFGSWAAVRMIQSGHIPATMLTSDLTQESISRVLVVNHNQGRDYSLLLISSC